MISSHDSNDNHNDSDSAEPRQAEAGAPFFGPLLDTRTQIIRPVRLLRVWVSEGLTQANS